MHNELLKGQLGGDDENRPKKSTLARAVYMKTHNDDVKMTKHNN